MASWAPWASTAALPFFFSHWRGLEYSGPYWFVTSSRAAPIASLLSLGLVGSHVGDQTGEAVGPELDALVQLLRDLHRLARSEPKAGGGVLLQGAGLVRRAGIAGSLPRFDRPDRVGRAAKLFEDLVGAGLVAELGAEEVVSLCRRMVGARGAATGFGRGFAGFGFAILAGGFTGSWRLGDLGLAAIRRARGQQPGHELGFPVWVLETGLDAPVLARLEGIDLGLALGHQAHGHRLHPPRRDAGLDLAPENRAQLVSHQPVNHPAGNLGAHKALVDAAWMLQRLLHPGLGDLLELDPLGVGELEDLCDVPRDALALPIRVSREHDPAGLLGRLLEVGDHLLLARDDDVGLLEVLVLIDAHVALGQVADRTHRGTHGVATPEVALEGSRLGGRLHDDQWASAGCGGHAVGILRWARGVADLLFSLGHGSTLYVRVKPTGRSNIPHPGAVATQYPGSGLRPGGQLRHLRRRSS